LSLRKSDLRPAALRRLQTARGSEERDGWLGRAYIEWFLIQLARDHLPPVRETSNRREHGEAILEWGWTLWKRFCTEVIGLTDEEVGELDLSVVRKERADVGEHPIATALEEAIEIGAREPGERDGMPVAWVHEIGDVSTGKMSVVAIRKRAFVKWAVNAGYQFPGGERSTSSWLSNRYGVDKRDKVRFGGLNGVLGSQGTEVRVLLLVGVMEDFALKEAANVAQIT
jgi:hypothetical protein